MKNVKRNDLCWCGSGLKYKKCHMDQDEFLKKLGRQLGCKIPRDIIKTQEQIDGIRKSGVITHNILDLVADLMKPGVSTEEVNTFVHNYTVEHGGIPATLGFEGYPKSVCVSINEVVCHGIPNEKTKFKEGDIVNVDVTTILNGYYADASRMYIVGEASKEAVDLVNDTRTALELGMQQVKPYNTVGDIGYAISKFAEEKGYSVVYEYGGHGVGIKFHEEPFISHIGEKGEGMILLPGMVFTIEPMLNLGKPDIKILSDGWTSVTIDNKLSAQWEHTLVVTDSGFDVLT
ncbi:methionine aminopeptidase, type I [Hathewaya proteolytica DSM 3090]|uniref:Methionine aminopeptidase n=1 Tax=Hathewaya proteolytica DSM 3090 TaxID=1121331 RepID=A0A1M6MQN5_9CLOT|nr:type I methionyl aminopeptidase [Hathewaya proteolytica]SHJ85818.1 methionine aminopeptidase, type I [Hathewaya proteolytica DSM 3090]